MLKCVVLYVLLWHGMCQFSSHAGRLSTDTLISNFSRIDLPKINNTGMQIETRDFRNASYEATHVNGSLPVRRGICCDLYSNGNRSRTDYVVTNGIGAHKLHLHLLAWGKTRRACADEGAHLAVIRSEAEEKIILKMMIDQSVTHAWLGYHDMFDEGDWISVFDEKINEGGWEGIGPKNGTPTPTIMAIRTAPYYCQT